MPRSPQPAVAASSRWTGDDGIRYPSGDTHAWLPGTNQTVCGVPLSRARLARFPHVPWGEALWLADTGDRRVVLCRLSDDDIEVMRRAVDEITAARGAEDDGEPRAGSDEWRRRLMSLGHDPLQRG
ncbi:hypothetical protein [Nocardia farcinica]|uniref:hypothetical protein n=1 Tax=Nocardia farcinica TaxID=37329 RepID=UPI0024563B8F|nr:hypothetical protein [Nocardia farcinica]